MNQYLPCNIRITGAGLRPVTVLDIDPGTGEVTQIHEVGQEPIITVRGLGDVRVGPQFMQACLQIHEALQKLPKPKLLMEE